MTSETAVGTETAASATAPEFGSEAALLQLRGGVLCVLNCMVQEPALAEDLCNETFRIVLERLRREPLEEPTKLAAYLAQTARSLAMADRRKTSRRQTITGEQYAIDHVADEGADPSLALESQTRAKAMRKVLEEMPNVRDRQLLVRFYLNDEDRVDICRDLNLTEVHFNRVIFRARERFRVLLDKRFERPDLYCLALV